MSKTVHKYNVSLLSHQAYLGDFAGYTGFSGAYESATESAANFTLVTLSDYRIIISQCV